MDATAQFVRTEGSNVIGIEGEPIRLRGVCLGGWLNMENFITGYAANESLMRSAVLQVLGQQRYDLFFESLLANFFGEADAALLASVGVNSVRIPINYRHFEDDAKPFVIKEEGFRHLDRAIAACAANGILSIIDLHAVPGAQNQHWHSDNATHRALFWEQRQFQDRAVHLWEAIADHYKDQVWVAGYNLLNEPADESRRAIGPFYARLVAAIRRVDAHHTLFVDGNTYSTEFDVFEGCWDNTVYTCHDYVRSGLGRGGPYPGFTEGVYVDRAAVERTFLSRAVYARRTGTPLYVGEFGPIYTGEEAIDEQRRQILADQLEIYSEYGAGWALWTYKDVGRQGLVTVAPRTPYMERFEGFIAKKYRLAADQWGTDGEGPVQVSRPVQALIAEEAPGFEPYPWGRFDWVRTLLLNIMVAQALVPEYARCFDGVTDDELLALAQSFALANCIVREPLREQLRKAMGEL
ncbi:MAG TPA: cellulase family glycosylhydrolase [Acidimicrobiales bacterium]|nr:cellulase family glycosylhydrolase [Acidimicrobiales bacterium]